MGIGLVIGIALSVATTRELGNLAYGVERLDPPTLIGVTALLAVVALVATFVPARHASAAWTHPNTLMPNPA